MSRQFEKGRLARIAGQPGASNPYTSQRWRGRWLAGWLHSDAKIRERERRLPSLEEPARGDVCPACGTQREVVGYCGPCDDNQTRREP